MTGEPSGANKIGCDEMPDMLATFASFYGEYPFLGEKYGAAETGPIALAPASIGDTTGCPGRNGARCSATAIGPFAGPAVRRWGFRRRATRSFQMSLYS